MSKLPKEFYRRDALEVARRLLGCMLCTRFDGKLTCGRIVETEAYCGEEDKASHAYGGKRTKRTETMYGPPGNAYVYLVYGLHHQFNAVASDEGSPHAVLIRAIEPSEGTELMEERRGVIGRNLTNGPGKLCQALGITREHNKIDLTGNKVWIEEGTFVDPGSIVESTRIGIDYAGDHALLPYRFYVRGSEFVSKK